MQQKHILKTSFILLAILLQTLLITSNIFTANLTRNITIVEVHSYIFNDICTEPQAAGFDKVLQGLPSNYKIDRLTFYMNTKTKNIDTYSKQRIAKEIIEKILKYKPDYIVTTDDDAFEFVGVPLSKKFKIFASGLNKSLHAYSMTFDDKIYLPNIVAVEETIRLDNVFQLLDSAMFVPEKFYFITEGNINTKSSTSFYMEKEYEREIKGKFPIEVVQVNSVLDLKEKILKLNQSVKQGAIVLIAQRLFDTENLKFVDKQTIAKILVKYNTMHLELGANPLFTEEHVGLSLCGAPTFDKMGLMLGKLFVDSLNSKFPQGSYPCVNVMWVNKQRLEYLNLSKLYTCSPNLINHTTYTYKAN